MNRNRVFAIMLLSSLMQVSVAEGLNIIPGNNQVIVEPLTHLQAIDDEDLGNITAEALFELNQNINSNGTQFLKFIFNATIDINANIRKLNLGDQIDLDYVSLTGDTRDPTSSAKIVRPFLELATKNYDDASNREIIGLRFGAESMKVVYPSVKAMMIAMVLTVSVVISKQRQ